MRELTARELGMVAGAGEGCPAGDGGGNNYGGVTEPESFGDDLIEIYEGVVAAVSHVIERVAEAL